MNDGLLHLADRLGQPVHRLMGWIGPLTQRQLLVWEAWFRIDDNRPSRADFYQMATRATLYEVNGEKTPPLDRMRVEIKPAKRVGRKDAEEHKRNVASLQKARAKARFGDKLTVIEVPKPQ